MERLHVGRPVVSALVALAMLAGCGGTGTTASVPSAITPGVARHATSNSGDLIYAASSQNATTVDIYTFGGSLVTTFTMPNSTHVYGMCSDTKGNAFVAAAASTYPAYGYIFEYPHGATSPSTTLTVEQYEIPSACSVDPNTENLAVADMPLSSSKNNGDVAIFTDAQGSPTIYAESVRDLTQVAYDNQSNLYAYDQSPGFLELPNGGSKFTNVSIGGAGRSDAMQWDGQDLAILKGVTAGKHSLPRAYRVALSGSSGHIVGVTHFNGLLHAPGGRFFLNGNMALVRGGGTRKAGCEIGVFRYPAGKTPEKVIPTGRNLDWVFTLSVAPTRK